jgi:hypothetical protein
MYPRQYFDTYWRTDLRDEVFVAMPFHDEFNQVWQDAIRPAIEQDHLLKLAAKRVDTSVLSGSIIVDILDGIAHSRLVFADVSVCREGKWAGQRNGNVMYEVGLTHALRQVEEIILVRCDNDEINFDLAGIRVNQYDRKEIQSTKILFSRLVADSLRAIDQSKSLQVQRAIDALDIDSLEYLTLFGEEIGFIGPNPQKMGEVLISVSKKASLARLQSLGIIKCVPVNNLSIPTIPNFHWTKFGEAVLKQLGFRR